MSGVHLEVWQLISLLLSFFAAVGAFGMLLMKQFEKHLDERFAGMEEARREGARHWEERFGSMESRQGQVERDLYRDFWRREDQVNFSVMINAKLDALAAKLDRVWERRGAD